MIRSIVPCFVIAIALACACQATGAIADPGGNPPPDAGARETASAAPDAAVPAPDQGAAFVESRGCPRCHQSTDPADGTLSGQTTPQPGTHVFGANLTGDLETGIGGWSDEMILRAIRTGVDNDGAELCATMPRFRDMGDDEGYAIIAYLRSLTPTRRKVPESECDESDDPSDGGEDAAVADATPDVAPPEDAGPDAVVVPCGSYVGPSTPATCHACGTRACQANGCYGGYWCETWTSTCHPEPAACR